MPVSQASFHKALSYQTGSQKGYKGPATDEVQHCWSRLQGSMMKLINRTGYFPILPSTCLLTKLLWHHTCFCTSLEASTAQQMAECLHNKYSRGSAYGSAWGGTGGAAGTLSWGSSTAISPRLCWRNIPPRKGRISLSSECSQLCSSVWQSFPG